MLPREELKKLERKAKALMLSKEIPQGKVDVVRSIMSNTMLLEEERFRAIIEILRNCPDKPQQEERPGRAVQTKIRTFKRDIPIHDTFSGPSPDTSAIRTLYNKRRKSGLFKIRYLAPGANRFGISFKKRLIPTKKCLHLMREIRAVQDKISIKIPSVMQMIIDDPTIEDPTHYNYLRIIQDWLMECPLAGLSFEQVKWMDRNGFETEIKNWCLKHFSLAEIDTGTKEAVIQALEGKLRETEELQKKAVFPDDPENARNEKERHNLECEKAVYDFMMTFRSFLPTVEGAEGIFARYISTRYGVASLRELSILLIECLVYGRETASAEITRYYSVMAPKVSSTEWNSSADTIHRAGKDAESKKLRYIEKIRDALSECEEVYSMLAMRYDSIDYVRKAFDEQWRVINKRRQDGSDIYERDYFAFIDECLSYFFSVFAPFINGTPVSLASSEGSTVEVAVFSPQYFQTELAAISNAHGEIFQKRSSGLTNTITRAEAKRLAAGQIPSMREIETLIKVLGSSFYSIGKILQKTLSLHRATLKKGQVSGSREPLRHLEYEFDGSDLIVPYYDYRFGSHDTHNAAQKMLVGMRMVSNAVKDGIINSINAFCFQFSQEFFDRSIANDLDYRKDLLKKIEEAERR